VTVGVVAPAGPGYDLATGWGSIDGAALFDTLAAR